MTETLLALIAGLIGLVVLAWLRWQDMQAWTRSLVRYELSLPRDLTVSEVASWLGQLSAITVPSRWSLLPLMPVGLEIEATSHGIMHFVLVPQAREAAVLASLRAALPRLRIGLAEATKPPAFQAAAELRLTNMWTPLAEDRVESAVTALLAALQPLPSGAVVRVQWLVAGARATAATASVSDVLGWLIGSSRDDRDTERDIAKKQRHPLLIGTGRVAVSEPTTGHAYGVMHRIMAAFRVLNAPGVEVRRRNLPTRLVRRRIIRPTMPFSHWPVFVNAVEAVGLVGLPLNGPALPGLQLGASRQVPLSPASPRQGVIVGESTYPGTPRPLALKPDDRLRHVYCLGPTGVGKSTLIANMALQDITAGSGVVVVDPKGDLVDDILSRFPDERHDDVILLDPANTAYPTGLNPLRTHGDEHQRELAAETTVHILRSIFRAYWGPRTDDILRAAIQSLVQVPSPNGQAFTMCEVPELLTNPALRRYVTNHGRLDERWREYWQWYDGLSDDAQLAAVGAPLNKLRAFTTRTSLRLVLGQSEGFDLSEVFTRRKVLLVPLAKGQIGTEAATLLGSLLVGALWQATLARSAVPAEKRRPVFAYLDEFQDIVRLTDDIADMLAQARGLGLSLTLAHQYTKQIPERTQAAVLGTARSQIFFQVEYNDARLLDNRVAPTLNAADLMGLASHEIAARLCVDGQTLTPVTGRTLPLPEPVRDARATREELAFRHGMARPDVDAGLHSRSRPAMNQRPIRLGEVPADGGRS